jgi:hypothetical protein
MLAKIPPSPGREVIDNVLFITAIIFFLYIYICFKTPKLIRNKKREGKNTALASACVYVCVTTKIQKREKSKKSVRRARGGEAKGVRAHTEKKKNVLHDGLTAGGFRRSSCNRKPDAKQSKNRKKSARTSTELIFVSPVARRSPLQRNRAVSLSLSSLLTVSFHTTLPSAW